MKPTCKTNEEWEKENDELRLRLKKLRQVARDALDVLEALKLSECKPVKGLSFLLDEEKNLEQDRICQKCGRCQSESEN